MPKKKTQKRRTNASPKKSTTARKQKSQQVPVRIIEKKKEPVVRSEKSSNNESSQTASQEAKPQSEKKPAEKYNFFEGEAPKKKAKPKRTPLQEHVKKVLRVLRHNVVALSIGVTTFGIVLVAGLLVERFFFYETEFDAFLPDDTIAFVSVQTDVLNREMFALKRLVDQSGALQESSLLDTQLTPVFPIPETSVKDLEPFVDQEVGIAVLPKSGDEVTYSLMVDVRSSNAARGLLEKLAGDAPINQTDYKGENIFTIEYATSDEFTLASRAVHFVYMKDVAVVTTDLSAAFIHIDVEKGDSRALAKVPSYKNLIATADHNPLGYFYADLERSNEFLGGVVASGALQGAVVPGVGKIAGAYSVSDSEFVFHANQEVSENLPELPVVASTLIDQVPSSVTMYMEAGNLSGHVDALKRSLQEDNPVFAFYFANLEKRLSNDFAFDLQDNFLQYFDRNFAVFQDASTSRLKTTGELYNNITFVGQMNDVEGFLGSQQVFQEQLASIVGSQFDEELVFSTDSVGDTELYALRGNNLPIDIYYAVIGSDFVVSTSKDVFQALVANDQVGIVSTSVRDSLDKQTRFYFANISLLREAPVSVHPLIEFVDPFVDTITVTDVSGKDLRKYSGTVTIDGI